jgi:CBS domain-containing protein
MQIESRGGVGDAQGVLGPTLEFLRQHAPFDRMTPSHLEFLAKHLRLGFYSKGKVVVEPSTLSAHTFYIVKQGQVRAEVDRAPAREFGPGDCFPIDAMLARRPVATTQRAALDSFCFELSSENFEKLVAQSEAFRRFCVQSCAGARAR